MISDNRDSRALLLSGVLALCMCSTHTAWGREDDFTLMLHDGTKTAVSVWSIDEEADKILYSVTAG